MKSILFGLVNLCVFISVLGAGGGGHASSNSNGALGISDDSESTQLIHIGFPTSLKCKVGQEEGENPKLKWSKDGDVISANDERYQIFKENSTLLIKKAEKEDVGVYRCDDNDFIPPRTSSISVIHLNFKTLPKSVTVLQGDKFALNCDVVGEPTPTVAWFKDGASVQDVMNASRYSLEPNEGGIKGAVLSVAVSEYEDRADYTCAISILDAHYNTTTLVRVKDMYAALWPFLGICAEVILLCVIIFIYEKRRAKNDFEESDTDQPPEQQKPAGEQQDSVRCRK